MTLATVANIDVEISILEKLIDAGKAKHMLSVCMTDEDVVYLMTCETPLKTVRLMLNTCQKAVDDTIGKERALTSSEPVTVSGDAANALEDLENGVKEYKELERTIASFADGHRFLGGLSKDTDKCLDNINIVRDSLTSTAKLEAENKEYLALLDEIAHYYGGADSALHDEYVMDRVIAVLAKKTL